MNINNQKMLMKFCVSLKKITECKINKLFSVRNFSFILLATIKILFILSASVFNRLLIFFNIRTKLDRYITRDFIYWREKKVGVICIPPLFMHLGVSVRQHITFFSVPIIGNFVYNLPSFLVFR